MKVVIESRQGVHVGFMTQYSVYHVRQLKIDIYLKKRCRQINVLGERGSTDPTDHTWFWITAVRQT